MLFSFVHYSPWALDFLMDKWLLVNTVWYNVLQNIGYLFNWRWKGEFSQLLQMILQLRFLNHCKKTVFWPSHQFSKVFWVCLPLLKVSEYTIRFVEYRWHVNFLPYTVNLAWFNWYVLCDQQNDSFAFVNFFMLTFKMFDEFTFAKP